MTTLTDKAPERITTASESRSGPVLIAAGASDVRVTARAAVLIASHLGREILLLSVIEPLPRGFWDDDGSTYGTFFEARATEARQTLALEIDPSGEEADWPVEVVPGKVPATIARIAQERHAPLVVMGASHHRSLERVLGAGNLLRTVRAARCPVLSVSSTFRTVPAIAAVGVDFSSSSAAAAQLTARLTARAGTLHLVHVHPPVSSDSSADDAVRQRAHLIGRLKRFASSLDLPVPLDVRCELREGKPAERLLDFIGAHHVELMGVGRNGHDMVERILVGSVAEQVLHSASCSVLVVPENEAANNTIAASDAPFTERRVSRIAWSEVLDRFARQNAGRVTTLDVDDPENDLASIDRGYLLFGTSCERGGRAVSILLGEPSGRRQHHVRSIPRADELWIRKNAEGAEVAIRIQHGRGETLLTLTGSARRNARAS